MFQITIENNDKEKNNYIIYGEHEFNFFTKITPPMNLPIPNYYELENIPSQYPIIKITNIVPIIVIPDQIITVEKNSVNLNFYASYPLELDEYEALYETYLTQMKNNPTSEFQTVQKIKNDIKYTKVLNKIKQNRA